MSEGAKRLSLAAVIVAAVLAVGLSRIDDRDFWWHIAAGRLIAETHSIPRTDVFSYTAHGHEYIDHEWLFQTVSYAAYSTTGPAGIVLLKCLLVAATLVAVALFTVSRGVHPLVAGGFALLSIAGGIVRIIERPELFSTLATVATFVVLSTWSGSRDDQASRAALDSGPLEGSRRNLILVVLPLLSAVWANVHAAVIVGLAVQVLFMAGLVVQRSRPLRPALVAFAASVMATGINPFGYRVLTVPFELTRIINSGMFDNREWRPPSIAGTPFYFLCMVIAGVFLVRSYRHVRLPEMLVAAFLAYISLRYVRNVGLFSVMFPLLIAPEAARLSRRAAAVLAAVGCGAFILAATVYYPFERGFGIASYFPERMTRYVREAGLRGHMFNSYGFGGYLIWRLFPSRLVFIDGRNEVYLPLLAKLVRAQGDSRAWASLLRENQVEYAVLEYIDDLDRVLTVGPDGRLVQSYAPFSANRFPRRTWALVYWDDAGMLFVRRGGVNAALISGEYDAVFPEGRGYQRQVVSSGMVERARAIAQLQRKISEDPGCRRARELLDSIR